MNYCQVEHDTEKYLATQCLLDAAQEAAEQEALDQIEDASSTYFYANTDNILEAISEAVTPIHNMQNGTYQEQLANFLSTYQYEAYGRLCEYISREYWTEWLVDLVD